MSPEQLHILQHALGLAQNDKPPAYRNHYVTGPGCDSFENCQALVDAGMMVDHGPRVLAGGHHCFSVTDSGEREARAAWEAAKPKLTRSQKRYEAWLDADCGMTFGDWLRSGA